MVLFLSTNLEQNLNSNLIKTRCLKRVSRLSYYFAGTTLEGGLRGLYPPTPEFGGQKGEQKEKQTIYYYQPPRIKILTLSLLCRVQLQQKVMFASYIQLLVQVHFENATLVWPFPQFSSRFLAKKFFCTRNQSMYGIFPSFI